MPTKNVSKKSVKKAKPVVKKTVKKTVKRAKAKKIAARSVKKAGTQNPYTQHELRKLSVARQNRVARALAKMLRAEIRSTTSVQAAV